MPAGNPQSFETLQGLQDFLDQPLQKAFEVYYFQFGGPEIFLTIFWGAILLLSWLINKNPLYTAILGIIVISSNVAIHPQVLGIGLVLLVFTIIASLYQLFVYRSQSPIG